MEETWKAGIVEDIVKKLLTSRFDFHMRMQAATASLQEGHSFLLFHFTMCCQNSGIDDRWQRAVSQNPLSFQAGCQKGDVVQKTRGLRLRMGLVVSYLYIAYDLRLHFLLHSHVCVSPHCLCTWGMVLHISHPSCHSKSSRVHSSGQVPQPYECHCCWSSLPTT